MVEILPGFAFTLSFCTSASSLTRSPTCFEKFFFVSQTNISSLGAISGIFKELSLYSGRKRVKDLPSLGPFGHRWNLVRVTQMELKLEQGSWFVGYRRHDWS